MNIGRVNKTTTEEVKGMLLSGRHITKLDLFYESEIASSCLPQRIYDIRQETDWDIKSQSVKGKGTLREYWLEPDEIARIKGNKETVPEPIVYEEVPVSDDEEQMSLGLFGEWW